MWHGGGDPRHLASLARQGRGFASPASSCARPTRYGATETARCFRLKNSIRAQLAQTSERLTPAGRSLTGCTRAAVGVASSAGIDGRAFARRHEARCAEPEPAHARQPAAVLDVRLASAQLPDPRGVEQLHFGPGAGVRPSEPICRQRHHGS